MEKQTKRYLQFPLFLMRGLFINKKDTIDKMLIFGICNYSTKLNYNMIDVGRQLIYDIYRGDIGLELKKQIKALRSDIIGQRGDEIFGSKDGEFDYSEIDPLFKEFDKDPNLKNNAIKYYQMRMAMKAMGGGGSIEVVAESAKDIKKNIPVNDPMPMLSLSHLSNFRKYEKSEFELAQFAAFVAIKSILGTKQYVKTNKMHIVSRMFGYSSVKHLPERMDPAIKTLFVKYNNRYHIDKVLQNLELNWNVLTYSNNIRGMYVAMENKMSINDLALISETKKQKNRIKELKSAKAQAKEKALNALNKVPQLK